MHDIFSREPDPLDRMLLPPTPPDTEGLRQSVYARTRHLLHRRVRVRQFAFAAALLVSFAAGAGVMRMTSTQPATITDLPARSASKAELLHPDNPLPSNDKSPLAREWIAFDSTEHRGELYRQAGDRYIEDENDLHSALRCYSNALDNGTERDLTISPDDNWLLMAIKDARQKEKDHAKQDG